MRLHSLASFKRRLNALGFACKFQASLAFAWMCLQISSVACFCLGSLASFKRRLDSLGFACKFQASLECAWVRLQVSSVAWIRLHSLANFKRRLLLLAFACKFQASLGFACVRLQVSSIACFRLGSLASFKHRFFATIVAASKTAMAPPSPTKKHPAHRQTMCRVNGYRSRQPESLPVSVNRSQSCVTDLRVC